MLSGVIDVLRNLLSYLMNLAENEDPEKADGHPVRDRQKCLKELSIIEMLMQVLYQTARNGLL